MAPRIARWLVNGGALAIVALALYVWLAPEHVVDGDNAELATVGAIGGRPHPSGYPVYVMYLRATAWLPGASPAHTAALATVLLASVLVYVLHAACRAWGAHPIAATFAVALYAASPVVLRMHTEAEVFALNGLVVAIVLWLSANAGPVRGVWRSGLLGLAAGLALGNHLTCVLVAPIGLLGAMRGVREAERRPLAVLAAIGGLFVGLASYAYLWVADGPVSFGRIDGVGDVVDFFLRTDYGGAGAFVPTGEPVRAWDNTVAMAATIGRANVWLPALAGLGMLGYRAVRAKQDGESRWAFALLAASFALAGPLLATRFNVPPTGLGLYVVQRFHLLPLLLLVVPVALAFGRAGEWLSVASPRVRSQALGTTLAVAVFATSAASSLVWLAGVHSPAMELGIRNLLRSLPPDAIVVASSEEVCFGGDYLQFTLDERPDVDVACWLVTSRAWYRERLAAQGVPIVGDYSSQPTRSQAEALLATGRPLFVDRSNAELLRALPSYPYATMVRVLPRGAPLPSPAEAATINRALFERFDLAYPRPHRTHDHAAVAHLRYMHTWLTLASALDTSGDRVGAAEALSFAAQLAPERD